MKRSEKDIPAMPKFFFSIDGEQPDILGVELPDAHAARSEAIRAAGEILRDIDGAFKGREWVMRVDDEAHDAC